jgi:5-methyltetrahydropteroyltriglutamate--homocysteine methyltransferase
MKRSTERYLTTHVGSMLRSPKIQAFNQALAAGQTIDVQDYEQTLRSDVAEVVRKQAECGIDVVSDGELGKPSWLHILGRVSGFELREVERPRVGFRGWDPEARFKDFYDAQTPANRGPVRQAVCVGPVSYTEQGRAQMQRDVANFRAALQHVRVEEAFLPVIAPCSISVNYRNEYYKDDEEFLFAVADALHEEYQIIIDAGLIVQTDDAILANLHDPVVDAGLDYRKWVGMNLDALNHALRGIPEDRVRYHLCWGSWPGPHTTDVPLAEIVDLVLKINCQAYSIEAANPRHEWEWAVWQDTKLPEGKLLLPGMVSHAISHVEHPELIAQRIKRYADLVGPENVIASTDCGFAQGSGTQRQQQEIVWTKLESLAEGARIASRRRK